MTRPYILNPLRSQFLEAHAQCSDKRVGWRERCIIGLQVVAVFAQIKIEDARGRILVNALPGLIADRYKGQSRRQHKCLLRSGDAYIDVPIVSAALGDAQAADAIDKKERIGPRHQFAEGTNVVTHAA